VLQIALVINPWRIRGRSSIPVWCLNQDLTTASYQLYRKLSTQEESRAFPRTDPVEESAFPFLTRRGRAANANIVHRGRLHAESSDAGLTL